MKYYTDGGLSLNNRLITTSIILMCYHFIWMGFWQSQWCCHLHWLGDNQAIKQDVIKLANKANLRDLKAATGLVISKWIQIVYFSARVTVKFDGWPRKTIGHFFYTTSSFVHHFNSIGEFKLDLQSRNAQFRSILVRSYPAWPYILMDDLGKQ